jgi:hypothetical protein
MNPLLDRCEALARAGRHITAVSITQATDTQFSARITLQDWAEGSGMMEGGAVKASVWERLPDVVWMIESTVEQAEDWIIELSREGHAIDWAKFDRPGHRSWLAKPNKWVKPPRGVKGR